MHVFRAAGNAMSLYGAYDEGNVFAKILAGEIPAAVIYEDDGVLALMDAFPQTKGHALVIPKGSKARNLLDIEPEALAQVSAATQRVAKAVVAALEPDGVVVKQFNGEAAGQSVFHLHFHIVPVWRDQRIGAHASKMADPAELKALAARIAAKLD
jgi:histidine triad (HIT) family protein